MQYQDAKGVILLEILPQGQCINAARYCSTLDRLKEAIHRKRPGLLRRGVVRQHDNETPHSANLTQQWLQRYGWEIFPHPAHSPDLAPSDFLLFGPLKRHLGGMAFETEDDLISELRNWFDNLEVDFFRPFNNDKTINTRLFTTLQRIRDDLIVQPSGQTQAGAEPQEGMDKILPASMAPHVNLTMSSNLFGLSERVVATESLMFLVKQLDYLHPYLEELIPANKKAFLSQFYSQTVHMASEVRKPVYIVVSRNSVAYDLVLQQMGTVKWDVKEIMSQHSAYIDTLLQSFRDLKQKLSELERRVPLPRPVTDLLWEQCIRQANRTFVEGYASSKKCSHEGRALMQLDFQQFLTNIDYFVELKPIPEREFVEAYIKAYYLSKTQLEVWVHDHKEYSNKQLLSLINCVQQLDRKSKQKLISMVEEMDRGRR
ncbi:coiled-coil domain-containing protein 132 [Plakobranchus ocellatus]|uniref:Coiled-coil domain-containing protein 132 n=1 Tax=Plakobranchus ocellatus TaxID=259542 RepID=A0AAV4DC68_9GAST|nr:coiled-coil domain-containing protein 132 [Plakobranchus ocellatus]